MGSDSRDSFVFYRSYYEAINELEQGDQVAIFMAISDYALNGKEPSLTGVPKAIFTLIKPNLDANRTKWENGKKGAEFGKLGGRPRKENQEETPSKPQENPEKTPHKPPMYNEDVIMSNEDVIMSNKDVNTPKPPKGGERQVSSCSDDDKFYPFDEFWSDYDKKVGDKEKLRRKWNKLSLADRRLIKAFIPLYKQAEPNKKYRKNPETFLNNKSWNDELIDNNKPKQSGSDHQQRRESVANLKNLCVAILTGDSVPERP